MIPRLIPVSLGSGGLSKLEGQFDGLVVLFASLDQLIAKPTESLSALSHIVKDHSKLNVGLSALGGLIVTEKVPGSRLLLSPLGSLKGDTDDVRRYGEAARSALSKCVSIGIKKPLFVLQDEGATSATRSQKDYSKKLQVALLGLLAEAYVPLQAREHLIATTGSCSLKISEIGFVSEETQSYDWVNAVEQGRFLARDIGGSDPERMSPLKCAQHLAAAFKDSSNIRVTVLTDPNLIKQEYPLMHAVARCSLDVSRHYPAVVRLEYHAPDPSAVKEK